MHTSKHTQPPTRAHTHTCTGVDLLSLKQCVSYIKSAGRVCSLIRSYKKMIIFCSVCFKLLLHLCCKIGCLLSKISLQPPVLLPGIFFKSKKIKKSSHPNTIYIYISIDWFNKDYTKQQHRFAWSSSDSLQRNKRLTINLLSQTIRKWWLWAWFSSWSSICTYGVDLMSDRCVFALSK